MMAFVRAKKVYLFIFSIILIWAAITCISAANDTGAQLSSHDVPFVAAADASDHLKSMALYVCDGIADDIEIQQAIDEHNVVTLSPGHFYPSSTILWDDGSVIAGAGLMLTYIDGTTLDCVLAPKPHSAAMQHVTIRGLTVQNGYTGIHLLDQWNPVLEDVRILSAKACGLHIDGGTLGTAALEASRLYVRNSPVGIDFDAGIYASINCIRDSAVTGCTVAGLDIEADNTLLDNVQIEANAIGVRAGTSTNTIIHNCWFDSNGRNVTSADTTLDLQIVDGHLGTELGPNAPMPTPDPTGWQEVYRGTPAWESWGATVSNNLVTAARNQYIYAPLDGLLESVKGHQVRLSVDSMNLHPDTVAVLAMADGTEWRDTTIIEWSTTTTVIIGGVSSEAWMFRPLIYFYSSGTIEVGEVVVEVME